VFDTLHCVANSDYLSLEPGRLAETSKKKFLSEHVPMSCIKNTRRVRACACCSCPVFREPVAQELRRWL